MAVSALREAIADELDAIPGVQVSAYIIANPTPPFIQILPAGVAYDQSMHRGHDDVTFTIQGVVARNSDVGAQKLLDRMLENTAPYSVKLTLESGDRTLGGYAQDLRVTDASGVQIIQTATGGEMLVVEWTVLVLGVGTL